MKTERPTALVLVDAMNLAFRTHHVHKNFTNKDGFPTGVIYGMLKMIRDIHRYGNRVVVCWDGANVWRKALITQDYKAGRTKVKDDTDKQLIYKQLPIVEKALGILFMPQYRVDTLEADDIIGVLAHKLSKRGRKVVIYSGDRDFFGCINDNVTVLRPEKGANVVYNAKRVLRFEKFAVDQWTNMKALVGDASDGYKGIPGVGPAAALKLIALGVEPQLMWEEQPKKLRKAFPKLKKLWKHANQCWLLANIPTVPCYPCFSGQAVDKLDEIVLEVRETVNNGIVIRKKEHSKAWDKFTKLCGRYELDSFFAERSNFFGHVTIK